jgi:hypothetical protein
MVGRRAPTYRRGMHMTLDIDLDALTGDHATEIGRILRYWGGAMKQLDVTQPMEHELSDSEYKIVGVLRLA